MQVSGSNNTNKILYFIDYVLFVLCDFMHLFWVF